MWKVNCVFSLRNKASRLDFNSWKDGRRIEIHPSCLVAQCQHITAIDDYSTIPLFQWSSSCTRSMWYMCSGLREKLLAIPNLFYKCFTLKILGIPRFQALQTPWNYTQCVSRFETMKHEQWLGMRYEHTIILLPIFSTNWHFRPLIWDANWSVHQTFDNYTCLCIRMY